MINCCMTNEYGHVTINCLDRNSAQVFPVLVLGNLALHKSTDDHTRQTINRGAWTITHIPTGWRIISPIRNFRKARTALKLFYGAMDWNFSTPSSEKIDNQVEIFRIIKNIAVENGLTFRD